MSAVALAYTTERPRRPERRPRVLPSSPSAEELTELSADELAAAIIQARSWDELLAVAREIWRFPVETRARVSERAQLCDVLAAEVDRRWGRQHAVRRHAMGME